LQVIRAFRSRAARARSYFPHMDTPRHGRDAGTVSGTPRGIRRATNALLCVSVALAALSLGLPNITDWPALAAPDGSVRLLVQVAGEQNLPTWFAVLVLGLAAAVHLLAACVARVAGQPVWRLWLVSAVVIAAMSLDDATSLHERLDGLGRAAGADSFPFAWVLPGAVLGLAVAASLILLARRLRGEARWAIVAGLALLIGAALGMETVNGAILEAQGPSRWYVVGTHLEELAEMIGGVLLLRGGLAALSVRATRKGEFVVGYGGGHVPRPRRHEAASPGRPSRPVVPAQATAGVPEHPDRTLPMTPVDGPPAEKAVPAG
jgi:hypothetical protein